MKPKNDPQHPSAESSSRLGASEALQAEMKEHQKSVEALRESESRLQAIIQTAVEGIVTINDRGIIDSVNPAAERMFGYSASELIGRNISILMPSPYREQHDGYIANYLRSGQKKIIGIGREVVGQRKDGSTFPMDLSVGEMRFGGRRLFTGILRDITPRKTAEEKVRELAQTLAEKNKELETIVYVASHDLRSPLVNIQGFSKELAHVCGTIRSKLAHIQLEARDQKELDTILSSDIPESIEYILAGVTKMDALLNGFLRFSRLGRAAINVQLLHMNSMLNGIIQAMEFQIKKSGTTLIVEDLPNCRGDETQINQVFSNLLDNALKYLDPKRPGQIRIWGRVENGNSIYGVEDNGMGIAPEHQNRVFEIFHRLNPTKSEGEGLGLTIAQRILERQDGKIWLESKVGQGTTFFVSLPRSPG